MESQTYFRSLYARTHHILRPSGREQWHQWSDRWIPTSCDLLLVRHVSRKAPKQVKTQVRGICQFDRTLQRPPHPLTIHSPNPLGVRVLRGPVSLFGLPGLQPNRLSSHFCCWTGVLLSMTNQYVPQMTEFGINGFSAFCASSSLNLAESRVTIRPSLISIVPFSSSLSCLPKVIYKQSLSFERSLSQF